VIPVSADAPNVPFSVVEDRDRIVISTNAMSIEVARETAALTYRTIDGPC